MEPHKDLADGQDQSKPYDSRLRPPKTVKKRRSAEANLNADQPTEAPAIRLSRPIDIDEDPGAESMLCTLVDFMEEQKRKRKERQESGAWVYRTIKCRNCDGMSPTTNKCGCRFSDEPDPATGVHSSDDTDAVTDDYSVEEPIPDFDNDDLWKIVKGIIALAPVS
ncbi:hypothetical protein ACJ73_02471 [Blastomyces percursus]|uniref:Uncharacterized protein n=1 Tax=Blastomyces percursus TaxID=1658174 RepID=A0A1J9QCB0_9EURO|nr:hypothetical protein ACJ73_02471 [Blastomyces percursus]